ncbi:putative magnesium or manganese-dependent protein phosphatase [Nostocoides japonicum T1-X7]|uniref:Putative magnesium or manganese-dependent protein phosphatase n=1 Tax=Nostocoides japonicum T1-X7 TaxID=1194083 RepID=A0A077LUL8_9MICO|nr:zinc-ribbon domain-containing protein [Tetrasphaera japonica]CCH77558.1 putative magnesium or manganese-dependent protein phosphatase [Tetrasphaera japonica T1-X7]
MTVYTPQPPAGASSATCPSCGESLPEGARFCEVCGTAVPATPTTGPADGAPRPASPTPAAVVPSDGGTRETPPVDDASPISTPTARPHGVDGTPVAAPRACAECGAPVGDDGYCTVCGTKAPSERDHFEEAPAAWVAGVCDRGVTHLRNEDAMALYADPEPGGRAVLVVCDGVSNSDDSDVVSLAAARAARDVLRRPLPKGAGGASAEALAVRAFADAAAAAQTAVIANTSPSSPRPASCTLVIGTVDGSVGGGVDGPVGDQVVRCAVIGDSRAYLLPDVGEGRQLLVDDSMAAALIEAGTPREQAEVSRHAHAITKWLGLDSPDQVPRTAQATVDGPGWLLVCSDGLWNYASEPAALRARIDAVGTTEPLTLARALVDWAIEQGGHDNITVTLARLGATAPGPTATDER